MVFLPDKMRSVESDMVVIFNGTRNGSRSKELPVTTYLMLLEQRQRESALEVLSARGTAVGGGDRREEDNLCHCVIFIIIMILCVL